MKTNLLSMTLAILVMFFASCSKKDSKSEIFADQGKLDSLIRGKLDFGTKEINDALIRKYQYQKKMNCGNTNGVWINKEYLNQSINGYTVGGIVIPKDTSNYSKWDFIVIYSGISISDQGDEKMEPSIFFYKGEVNANGDFVPSGLPITDLKFLGGGGGDGKASGTSPPPTRP